MRSNTLFDEGRDLSRRHKDTEMNENAIGTIVVDCAVELHRDLRPGLLNFGEALMRDGITRIVHGNLGPEPPCLGASVREAFIEPDGPANPDSASLRRDR